MRCTECSIVAIPITRCHTWITIHRTIQIGDVEGGNDMSSGAYALFVDQPAGGGGGATIQRVIPLVPVSHQGGISFNSGWLSLAYDNFGSGPATIDVSVRVITGSSTVRLATTVSIPVGRTVITQIMSGDHAASLTVTGPAGARPALTALVEFDD
jgi:hypothetical protein